MNFLQNLCHLKLNYLVVFTIYKITFAAVLLVAI
jgi:hypothetical protein